MQKFNRFRNSIYILYLYYSIYKFYFIKIIYKFYF